MTIFYFVSRQCSYNSIGGLVVKLAVAIQDLRIYDVGQPRVRFPADAFLFVLPNCAARWLSTFCSGSVCSPEWMVGQQRLGTSPHVETSACW
jgi:hypothetical protein